MKRPTKDAYHMAQLPAIAARSHDPNTQTSCKVVGPDGETRSDGYNGFPLGCWDDAHPERLERPEKYFWIEHAERNAIYNAARVGTPLKGCMMYLSWLPCMDCARAIVQAGIVRLVCDKAMTDSRINDPKWKPDFDRVLTLLEECGVRVEFYE
jgi:dCMP deaminase